MHFYCYCLYIQPYKAASENRPASPEESFFESTKKRSVIEAESTIIFSFAEEASPQIAATVSDGRHCGEALQAPSKIPGECLNTTPGDSSTR